MWRFAHLREACELPIPYYKRVLRVTFDSVTGILEITSKFPNEYVSMIPFILDLPQITRQCSIKVNLST